MTVSSRIAPARRSLQPWHWWAAAILLVAIAAYAPSLGGSPIWEDRRLIGGGERTLTDCFRNPFLGTYFRPLVSASFLLDRLVGGGVPFQYHQTNVLIHAATVAVSMAAIGASLRSRTAGLIGGLALALQPAQVGAVAWIGGRTDSLCVLFSALMALALMRFRDTQAGHRVVWLLLMGFALLAAALSKEQALALAPWTVFGAMAGHSGDGRARRRDALAVAGAATCASLAFLILWWVFGGRSMGLADHGAAYRWTLSGQTWLHYLVLLGLPNPWSLHSVTTTGFHEIASSISAVLGHLLAAAMGAVGVLFARRGRTEALWIGWIACALLPVSNVVPVSSLIVAPYRAALAGVGVAALMGAWGAAAAGTIPRSRGALGAYLCATGLLTVWGVAQWTDEARIHATLSKYDPGSLWVQEGSAADALSKGRPGDAARRLAGWLDRTFAGRTWEDSTKIRSALAPGSSVVARIHAANGDKREPRRAVADVLTLLAYARMESSDPVGADAALAAGAAADPANPSIALAQGRLHMRREHWSDAVAAFDRSIAANPRIPTTHILRGLCLRALRRWAPAAAAFESALALEPWVGRSWLMLAEMKGRLGDASGRAAALQAGRDRAHTDREEIVALLGGGRDPGPSGAHGESGHAHPR